MTYSAEASKKPKINIKRLIITVAVGAIPTIVLFLWSQASRNQSTVNVLWWLGSASLLITLFVACFSISSALYAPTFTLLAVFAIAWISGSLLQAQFARQWTANPGLRDMLAWLCGIGLGVGAVAIFWFVVLSVSTKWILGASDSLGVSWWEAFRFVAARTFDTSQYYWVVENGEISLDNSKGLLAKFGGPGVLVIRPGNVVVLERGGRTSRILGPGVHALKYLEFIKKPENLKGIIDLRSQFVVADAENVLTQDGIPLKFQVSSSYVIEPKNVTDQRLEMHYEPPDESTVLGLPEYPVYESTIRKAVFNTTAGGWKGLFPGGPISRFRDVVGTYTLDQIFPPNPTGLANPDDRVLRKMEEEVGRQFVPAWAGVKYNGFDIMQVSMTDDVRERLVKRWTQPVDMTLMVQEARHKAQAVTAESEGRARALERMGMARSRAWETASEMMLKLMEALDKAGHKEKAWEFVNVIRQLTVWAGQDDTVAMNYIEAIQQVVKSEGSKHFVLQPVTFGGTPELAAGSTGRGAGTRSTMPISIDGQTQNGDTILDVSDLDDTELESE